MLEIWLKNERASNGLDRCNDPGRNTVTGDTDRLLDANDGDKHQIHAVGRKGIVKERREWVMAGDMC